MARLHETMTKCLCCGWTVRVWRTATPDQCGPDDEIRMALEEEAWHDRGDIAAKLDSMAGIAAYEILDGYGNGTVCYVDWP